MARKSVSGDLFKKEFKIIENWKDNIWDKLGRDVLINVEKRIVVENIIPMVFCKLSLVDKNLKFSDVCPAKKVNNVVVRCGTSIAVDRRYWHVYNSTDEENVFLILVTYPFHLFGYKTKQEVDFSYESAVVENDHIIDEPVAKDELFNRGPGLKLTIE